MRHMCPHMCGRILSSIVQWRMYRVSRASGLPLHADPQFPLPPCVHTTGADIRSVCTEAGMYAIRARRKTVTEKDFLEAVNKVIKGYQKFSATPKYMVYN